MDEDLFDKALEKLWIHKGAVLDFAENVVRGEEPWRASYLLQGEQKRAQIDQMIRFAESNSCRMNSLVRHFGDISDERFRLWFVRFLCSRRCVAQRFRTATDSGAKHALSGVAHAAVVSDEIDRQTVRRAFSRTTR